MTMNAATPTNEYITKYYFKFKEVLSGLTLSQIADHVMGDASWIENEDRQLFEAFIAEADRRGVYSYITDHEEIDINDKDTLSSEFINQFYRVRFRYIPLLKAYNAAKDELMADLVSTTVSDSRFNDTPQNSGIFEDNAHNTNTTKGESTTTAPAGTKAQLLAQNHEAFTNLVNEWLKEMSGWLIINVDE